MCSANRRCSTVKLANGAQGVTVEWDHPLVSLSLALPDGDCVRQKVHVIPTQGLDLARPARSIQSQNHRQPGVLPFRLEQEIAVAVNDNLGL